jgi:hypothetical protein
LFSAVAQSLVPLQLLMPAQCTTSLAATLLVAATADVDMASTAAAAAIRAPALLVVFMVSFLNKVVGGLHPPAPPWRRLMDQSSRKATPYDFFNYFCNSDASGRRQRTGAACMM